MKSRPGVVYLLAVVLVFGGSSASGQDRAAEEARNPRRPRHRVDVRWDIGEDMPFQPPDLDAAIRDDIPRSANPHIGPIGLGHPGETPSRAGIPSQVDGQTRTAPAVRKLGPGFLPSKWDEASPFVARGRDHPWRF